MRNRLPRHIALALALTMLATLGLHALAADRRGAEDDEAGKVHVANLIYANGKTSVCFSNEFLKQIEKDSLVRTHHEFGQVRLESTELYDFPFAVMTGEGQFTLTAEQRENLRNYLTHGGFVIASAGCSSRQWNTSFRHEIEQVFPDLEMKKLEADHPVFHTVYDINSSRYKRGEQKLPDLYAIEVDGKVVLIHSPDGLNDTANGPSSCCCCGGNEIKSAKEMNVNLLAYALTH